MCHKTEKHTGLNQADWSHLTCITKFHCSPKKKYICAALVYPGALDHSYNTVDAAFQRDFDRLQKWPDRSLLQLSMGKGKVLHVGRNNPLQQYVLGTPQL